MNRYSFTSKDDLKGRLCDTCGDELFSWNTGKEDDIRCKACYKVQSEAVYQDSIRERAYYLHLENPERSAEENWNIAFEEAESKRFDRGATAQQVSNWLQSFSALSTRE